MTWNYRVCKSEIDGYGIYEVYYREDGSIRAWSEDAIEPYGETFEELVEDFKYMSGAFAKEVIELPPGTAANGSTGLAQHEKDNANDE